MGRAPEGRIERGWLAGVVLDAGLAFQGKLFVEGLRLLLRASFRQGERVSHLTECRLILDLSQQGRAGRCAECCPATQVLEPASSPTVF